MAKELNMRVEVFRSHEKPNYMPLVRHLTKRMIEEYSNAEYEKRYREWARERGKDPLKNGCLLSRIPDEVLEDQEAYHKMVCEIIALQGGN